MNINGRTPEQSGIELGTITPVVHTQGNGRKRTMYRVQYNTMYMKYGSHSQAVSKRDEWLASDQRK